MAALAPALRRLTVLVLVLVAGFMLAPTVASLPRTIRQRWLGETAAEPQPWPDWYRRLVRLTHPVAYRLGVVGGRRSPMASVEYVGRRSGIVRQTPVWAFVTSDHVLVGLPYGRDVNWAQNVLAAGHCRIRVHGQVYELDEPQVRTAPECTDLPERRKRMMDSTMEYLRLRIFSTEPGTLESVTPAVAADVAVPTS